MEDGTYRQARDFNPFGEQSGAAVSVGGSAVFSWSVERDAAGRIVRKQEMLDGNAQLYEYDYDELGRLTSVTLDGLLVESYAYGAYGARTLETNALRGVVDKAYAYGADHRLLSAGDTNYAHDADGFLQRRTRGAEVTEYAYASTGEPRSVLLSDGRLVEYDNDAMGRRVAKRIDGAIVEKYLWLGRTRLLAVYHGDGSLKYRFEYADDRTPVAMTHAGERFYLAYDQVGSLRAVTDASGAMVKAVTYDSFGNVLEDSNPALDLPFGFAGGLHDADSGLVRFGYRDYAPEVGRWTAKDPIGFGGGDSDLYGYCGGDPVNYVDIDGLENSKTFFNIFNFGISLDIFRGGVDLSYTKYSSPCHIIECITISVSKGPGKGIALYSETGEYGRSLLNDSPTPSSGFVAGSSGYMASLHGGASGQFSLDSGGGGAMSGGIGTIIGLGGAVGGFLGYTICW